MYLNLSWEGERHTEEQRAHIGHRRKEIHAVVFEEFTSHDEQRSLSRWFKKAGFRGTGSSRSGIKGVTENVDALNRSAKALVEGVAMAMDIREFPATQAFKTRRTSLGKARSTSIRALPEVDLSISCSQLADSYRHF